MRYRLPFYCEVPLWVEFVGAAGSGKSTIIHSLVSDVGGAQIDSVSLGLLSKTRAVVASTITLLMNPDKLTWTKRDWRKNTASLLATQHDLRFMKSFHSGVVLLDEGPIHKLATKHLRDDVMKQYWEDYSNKTINSIVSCIAGGILVVKVNTDRRVRFERRQKRKSKKDTKLESYKTWQEFLERGSRRPSLGTLEKVVVEQLTERLGSRFMYHEVDGEREASAVAAEVVSLIRGFCDHSETAAGEADD